MYPPPRQPAFGITHPLGLARPLDTDNFFGAQVGHFAGNLMPIPSGCLAHFDEAVYRPYMERLVDVLKCFEFGWAGPTILDDPPRYCLVRWGRPAAVSVDLQDLLPEPPKVTLETVLDHFGRRDLGIAPLQLLDVLTLVGEDLGPERFAAATAAHPWVAEFMR
jgi:hypothetical protein